MMLQDCLKASINIIAVVDQKSVGSSRVQKPPSITTVAHMKDRAPQALPTHSRKAAQRSSMFGFLSVLGRATSSPPLPLLLLWRVADACRFRNDRCHLNGDLTDSCCGRRHVGLSILVVPGPGVAAAACVNARRMRGLGDPARA